MLFEKRYVFNAHTVAVSADILRFKEEPVRLDTSFEGSAALAPTGGSLRSQSGPRVVAHPQYGFVMSFECAKSAISGEFDPKAAFAQTVNKDFTPTIPAHIVSETSVSKLNIQNRLLIEHLELRTNADDAGVQTTPVVFSVPVVPQFINIRIDGKPVAVDIDQRLLAFPNLTALAYEYERNPDFRKLYANRFYRARDTPDDGKLPLVKDYAAASMIRAVSFPQGTPDSVTIQDPNTIKVKNFGRVILGEYFLGDRKRYATLVRLELGCDWGGRGSFASSGSNPVGDPMP